jgi:hypothetical protein
MKKAQHFKLIKNVLKSRADYYQIQKFLFDNMIIYTPNVEKLLKTGIGKYWSFTAL